MSEASFSNTPLRATFRIKLNGETISITNIGQAHRFITNLSSIEWMEFRSLHYDAVLSLQEAAKNAMLTVQATNALRARIDLSRAAARELDMIRVGTARLASCVSDARLFAGGLARGFRPNRPFASHCYHAWTAPVALRLWGPTPGSSL
jgi:hypothetical protein